VSGGGDALGYLITLAIAAVFLIILYLVIRSRPRKKK
jgi:hypothetical protein